MSRLFDDAQSEYLQVESPVVTAYPFAMACKFRSNDDTVNQALMFVGDKNAGNYFTNLVARGGNVGDPIYASSHNYGGVATASAITSTGFTQDIWHYAAGIWLSASERHAYIDGGSKGSDFTEVDPMANHDRTAIGAARDLSPGMYASGDIAEAAVWDLTDWGVDDAAREIAFEKAIASLAKGFSPLLFPLGLKAYWPLVRGLNDRVGGFNMTATGTVVSDHPKIILPTFEHIGSTPHIDVTVELATQQLALTQHALSLAFDYTVELATLELALTQHALTVVIPTDVTVLLETLGLALIQHTPEVITLFTDIPPFMLKDLIDPYSGGVWLWLVEIAISGYPTQRIAKNTENIIYGSVLFPKGNFDPGKQSLAGDASIPRVQLRVAQDGTHVLEDIVNASKGGENGTVKLIRTCEKYLDMPVAALQADYDILTAGSDPMWVMFVLGIPNPLLQRIPLWAYSSKVCPLATPSLFKGPRCQYTGGDSVCTGLFEDCYVKGNAVHWGAEAGLDPNAVRV